MDNQEQPKVEKKPEAKQNYFFPNTKQGLPFSCEAVTRQQAEDANKDYLQQQKETN